MSQPTRRFLVVAAMFLLGGGLLGGLLGNRVRAEGQVEEEGFRTFGQVLALVENQYVGEADTKELVEQAIGGMLSSLDPHSNYLSPDSFSEMRDEQRGKFHGLGIQITKRGPDKPLTIIAPIDDTPASRAGLQSGDIISHIEGEPTIDLTVQQAVRLLKGDKGTRVNISIRRHGLADPFDVSIERGEIPITSVRVAYTLDDGVGVVRIANFNTTTAEELDQAVADLREQGMTRLILDLRSNPGGLLDQAVQVSERFVPTGQLIVRTKGRIPGSNQEFMAEDDSNHVGLPLVVLVDRHSASASEIVSGAIQDHDRGLVVGEVTFGKGLVQRVIPLKDGGALAVTTAKYYTPAGRLIQRDYTNLDDYYLNRPGEEDEPESEEELAKREVFHTTSGREVYGGGGITPDYIVKSPRASEFWLRLIRENLIFDHAVGFVNERPELEKNFALEEKELEGFKQFLAEREFEYTEEEWLENLELVTVRLRAQIARVKWDQVEEARIIAGADPQIIKALEVLDEAARLTQKAARIEHERGSELRASAAAAS